MKKLLHKNGSFTLAEA